MLRRSPSRRAFLPRNLPLDSDFAISVTSDWSEIQWAEARINDEIDLIIFEIREDIVAEAFHQCYDRYLEKQAVYFTVHCTGQALLKMVDVYYFGRDPGELPYSRPELDFPNKSSSWLIDPQPPPAASDMWASNKVKAKPPGVPTDVKVKEVYSADSLFYPAVSPIPSKYRYRDSSPPDERSEIARQASDRDETSTISEEYSSEEVCKIESYDRSHTSLQHLVTPEVEDSDCICEHKRDRSAEARVGSRKPSYGQRGDVKEMRGVKKSADEIVIDAEPLQSELIPAMRISTKDLPPLRLPTKVEEIDYHEGY